jgi:N-acetylneuraminate synthase
MIDFLTKKFPDHVIGYSDHTVPDPSMTNLTSAYLLGAKIIEKHFTNNKNLKGNDHYHSMDKENLMKFKKKVSSINKLLGNYKEKTIIPTERISRLNARRSIVAIKNIKKGTMLSKSDLICKRPGTGISPIFWYKIIGKKVKKNIKSDKLISWSDLY